MTLWNPAHTVEVFEWLGDPQCCTACAPKEMPPQEVSAQVNLAYPQGDGLEWKEAGHGEACPENAGRIHLVMTC
jgi:hypothetical protein